VPTQVFTNSTGAGGCTPVQPLAGVVAIAGGGAFNVALKSDGSVVTWGDNTYGQLGNGVTGGDSAVPVAVTGLGGANQVQMIAAGANHALALKIGGGAVDTRVAAWGRNNAGQLGSCDLGVGDISNCDTAGLQDRNVPVEVRLTQLAPTKGVSHIAAGLDHSLIVYQTGRAASFGNNTSGQLGRTVVPSSTPANLANEFGNYTRATRAFAGPAATRSFVYVPGGGSFGRFESTGSNGNGELGTGSAGANATAPVPVTVVTAVGDKIGKRTNFGTDASRSDLLWRSDDGANVTWDFTSAAATGYDAHVLPGVDTSWQALATADVNGDGRSDVVWRDTASGQVAIWLMDGPDSPDPTPRFPGTVGAPWQFAGAGDFDGDGRADLLWRNGTTGEMNVWYMGFDGVVDQSVTIGTVSIASGWQVAAIADVNGDHVQDIVWFRASDGQVAIWRMAATGAFQGLFPAAVGPGASWRIYKAADFDGDGRDDLFWRNEATDPGVDPNAGTNAIWFFRGGNLVEDPQFFVGTPLAQWRIEGVGDFDGDGHDDLMWFDIGNGTTVRWLMHERGVTPTYETVTGIGLGWHVAQ
jgi:hypothetical protein